MTDVLAAITLKKEAAIAQMREKADELQELQKRARQLAAEFWELQHKVNTYVEIEQTIMGGGAVGTGRIALDDGAGSGAERLHED